MTDPRPARNASPFPASPVVPTLLAGDKVIHFRCRPGIACWNVCCGNIDISLTPYDILRLKRRLGLTSGDFLVEYTLPYEIEKDGIAGVKLRPVEGGSACRFMRPEGCSVYDDRPTACRYYPVALLSMRRQDEFTDTRAYALVKEPHCLGHQEERAITIEDYRVEQGVEEYDGHARGWHQLVLKKKSSGPSLGTPSKRSLRLFFMACYDLDAFRAFVASEGFRDTYELDADTLGEMAASDEGLMRFAFPLLRQVLFNEPSIPVRADAEARALARRQEQAGLAAELAQTPPEGG